MYHSNINSNDYAYSSFSCSTSGDINQPPPPPPPSYGNNRGFLYYNNIGTGTDLNPSNLDTKLDEESPLSSFSSFLTQYSPNVHLEDDAILRQHLHDLILHQQQPPTSPSPPPINHDQTIHDLAAANDDDYTEKNSSYTTVQVQEHFPPRKRSSKKDRHSKIDTALGPRDRRMRLSLDVARSFFGLQDILGFDKASKTVEWLLNKSKTAIKELKRGLSHDQLKKHSCSFISASSTSESCEVLSGMDECAARINDENRSLNSNSCSPCRNEEGEEEEDKKTTKKKSKRKEAFGRGLLRRTTPHHPLAKETRERARARARERTIQKRINNIGSPANTSNSTGDQLRSKLWNPFEVQIMGQSANQTHEEPGSSSIQLKDGGMSNIVGDSSLVTGNWIPAPIFFNYQQNSGPSQEHHQITDFECFGKPWEGINN